MTTKKPVKKKDSQPKPAKVSVLYTKHRDGDIPTGQAFLDAGVANKEVRGCIIVLINKKGETDTRFFGYVKKQEALWAGMSIVGYCAPGKDD